jgi:hypothetical protein
MSPISKTNDPKERDPWSLNIHPNGELTPDEQNQLAELMPKLLQDTCRILCLSMDYETKRREVIKGFAHDRMWAQYADNHTGVCIALDHAALKDRIGAAFREHIGRHESIDDVVTYTLDESLYASVPLSDLRRLGVAEFLQVYRVHFFKELYLVRNPDWETEAEYRFVWVYEDHPGVAIDVPIEGCIKALYLGSSFPEVYKQNIQYLQEQIGFDVFQIKYVQGRLTAVSFDPYRWAKSDQ